MAAIADERPPAESEIDAVLEATGKSVQDLREAVERLIQRRQAFAIVTKAKTAPTAQEKITAAIDAATTELNAAIDAARTKFTTTVQPLYARERELKLLVRDAEQKRTFLVDTADDPEAQSQIKDLEAQLQEIRKDLGQHTEAAHDASQGAMYAVNIAKNIAPDALIYGRARRGGITAGEQLKRLEVEEQDHLAAVGEGHQMATDLENRIAELHERLLTP